MALKRIISASQEGLDRIIVNVQFFGKVKGKNGKVSEKLVHELNHAFNSDMSEEEILEEIDRAEMLFLQEQESAEAQKEVDEKSESIQSKVSNLNSNSTK